MPFSKIIKDIYWKLPFLSPDQKEAFFYEAKKIIRSQGVSASEHVTGIEEEYIRQVLSIPTAQSPDFKVITDSPYKRQNGDPKLIAYYLPQMHPTPENNAWWGRGVTEWNNVSRAVPQYLGHYQPRLPGELGFYDLRLKENLARQIILAKMYGIFGFSWYYYWFDGERLLDRPLDMFLNDSSLDFPFCLCWANESWTRGFFGSTKEIIMRQSDTEESYRNFIQDAVSYMKDRRYIRVKGKKLLIIYKPQMVPNPRRTLDYWREYCAAHGVGDIYIIGGWTADWKNDVMERGFDSIVEFQPGSLLPYCRKINRNLSFVNKDFVGEVYSYQNLVNNGIYKKNFHASSMYNAVMPMWDNTPRRNNHGNVIFHGATPALYKKWLSDVIFHYKKDCCLDDDLIFINAWNEWGEGAYLEPDRYYGYAYLEATKAAMEEMRNKIGEKLMINKKRIGIVILNYNDAISTLRLVHLIHDYSAIDHVVLVDNLSTDGSMHDLQKAVDNKIDVIQSDRNGGYSYGNNFGAFYLIKKYNIDILFIANPDVEFTEDFLIRVVSDMERYNAKAASGYMEMPKTAPKVVRNPKINSVLRETIDCTILIKHIFPFKGAVLHKGCGVKHVEWIPGSLFAIDAKTYKKLNGLDDRVFLFYEEQILGWRFIQSGYKMVIDTDISYFHNHSVSINKSIKRYGQVKQLFHSKYYFYKNYVGMNLALQLLMKLAIVYGLFMRKLLYRVI